MTITNILLTGKPGVGKTTIIDEVAGRLGRTGVGGFFTREIREGDRRMGFEIITVNGKKGILSHVNVKSKHRVSRYGVDVQGLEKVAVAELCRALAEEDLIVIDEIGKMELCSSGFRTAVIAALDSKKIVLATIMSSPLPFTERIKRRDDTRVVPVTTENRDSLPDTILDMIANSKGRSGEERNG